VGGGGLEKAIWTCPQKNTSFKRDLKNYGMLFFSEKSPETAFIQ
jgi:hypothetical protein